MSLLRSSSQRGGAQVRMPCGCYSTDDSCNCYDKGSPDPWLVAGDDVNLNRLAETRSYRQSKFRG